MSYLILFAALQGFVIGIAILSAKNPVTRTTNRLFATLILIVSLFLLINSQIANFEKYPRFFLAAYILVYIYIPIYFFFLRSIFNNSFKLVKKDFVLFFPAIIYSLLLVRYFIMPKHQLLDLVYSLSINDLIFADLTCVILNIYLIWLSTRFLRKSPNLEAASKNMLVVFYFLHAALLITNLIWCVILMSQIGLIPNMLGIELNNLYHSMSLLIYLLAYILIVRNQYFFKSKELEITPYKNVSYQTEELQAIKVKINNVLEIDKAYTDHTFSLGTLSELTGIERFKLSYTINNHLNSSFTELVNLYRINEFVRLTETQSFDHYTMMGIANEAGFKSKSTFYKAFKDLHRMTPKEYLEKNQSQTALA